MYLTAGHARTFSEVFFESPIIVELSDREKEIAFMLVQGKTNKDISDELFISPGTVRAHASHIYAKLGVHDRNALASLFEKEG